MKALIAIFTALTIFVLNTAQAAPGLIVNNHYSCSAIIDADGNQVGTVDSFEIFEELVPAGPMLPAFNHVWTLLIKDGSSELESQLNLMQYNGSSQVLSDNVYTVEVMGDRALVKTEQGVAKCVSASYVPGNTCTKDINQFGHPSVCFCNDDATEKYNEVIGRCEIAYL